MILNIAVSSWISGCGVRNDKPGVREISLEHEAESEIIMMSDDSNLFMIS
jgi:hypothetical protein